MARALEYPVLACLWNLAWAFAFVLSLYVWKYDSKMTAELRDQPYVVWQRFTSVSIVTTCFVLLTPLELPLLGFPHSIARNLIGALVGLVICMILYLGPLTYQVLDPEAEILTLPPINVLSFRNIIFASIVEEISFRSCMIPIMLHAGFSSTAAIFLTPVFFGLAHVHHIMNDNGDVISFEMGSKSFFIKKVYLQAIVQGIYTTVFGSISSYLFIHTGTILAPILAHSFCNFMGLPPTDFFDHPRRTRTFRARRYTNLSAHFSP